MVNTEQLAQIFSETEGIIADLFFRVTGQRKGRCPSAITTLLCCCQRSGPKISGGCLVGGLLDEAFDGGGAGQCRCSRSDESTTLVSTGGGADRKGDLRDGQALHGGNMKATSCTSALKQDCPSIRTQKT